MLSRFFIVPILLSLIMIPVLATVSQARSGSDTDLSDPESIDKYQEDIGDFLDVDVSEFAKEAQLRYNAGEYEDAAKYYLAALRYDINDGGSIYNPACCYNRPTRFGLVLLETIGKKMV